MKLCQTIIMFINLSSHNDTIDVTFLLRKGHGVMFQIGSVGGADNAIQGNPSVKGDFFRSPS